jgi:hypothetical protein
LGGRRTDDQQGEETCLVISGEAERPVGDGAYVTRPAGTLAEPFLGAWRWGGDLDLSSFSVDNG